MSVPIGSPECGCDHLHASVYIDAETGDRFEVTGLDGDGETVHVRFNADGDVREPEEAHLLCCACDWNTDLFVRPDGDERSHRPGL